MRSRSRWILPMAAMLAGACSRAPQPDAYGNFEATEVVVAAESSGQLLRFTPAEGDRLPVGTVVGVIDTTQLALEHAQAVAQRGASTSRTQAAQQQIQSLEVQLQIAQRNHERTERLFREEAATAQQRDQAEREYRVLVEQVDAARAQHRAAALDAASAGSKVAMVGDRMRRSAVRNPVGGTVLATYAEAGEFVQPGQPLYKIADLDSMVMRAYVTETQLARVRIGQQARVTIDDGRHHRRELPGTVTWVSSEAEFTPTPIQTRDERANLVYAVKIRVPNGDGALKIGMPADARFTGATAR